MAVFQTDSRDHEPPIESIQGYDGWPYNHGKPTTKLFLIPELIQSVLSTETC